MYDNFEKNAKLQIIPGYFFSSLFEEKYKFVERETKQNSFVYYASPAIQRRLYTSVKFSR